MIRGFLFGVGGLLGLVLAAFLLPFVAVAVGIALYLGLELLSLILDGLSALLDRARRFPAKKREEVDEP